MDWHIITSSKGGVGKTLVSVMLLMSSCEQSIDKKNSVLAIDLNGMNADLRRMMASGNRGKHDQFSSENFHFEAVLDSNYIMGWPKDAFKILTAKTFFGFLWKINQQIKAELETKFKCTISTVIIDTNYHFCNLFPREIINNSSNHQLFNRTEERFFIWFIWVYRQLSNLFDFFDAMNQNQNNPYHADARTVQDKGVLIERKFSANNFVSPFVHVFSPNSVGHVSDNRLVQFFLGVENPLRQLAYLKNSNNCTRFSDFIAHLKTAKQNVGLRQLQQDETIHQYFIRILGKYIVNVRHGGRPKNVVPVLFEECLLGYTESENPNLINTMRELGVYINFKEAYNALIL